MSQWEHHIPAINCDKGMWCHLTRIELFYFNDNFCHIAQWVLAFRLCPTLVAMNLMDVGKPPEQKVPQWSTGPQ